MSRKLPDGVTLQGWPWGDRLAPGEFLVPPSESQGRQTPGGVVYARYTFWAKVRLLVDDFLPSIEALLPDYRQAFGSSAPGGDALVLLARAQEQAEAAGGEANVHPSWRPLLPLAQNLRAWGEHWHLTDAWCLETVLETCFHWSYAADDPELARIRDERQMVSIGARSYATPDEKAPPFLLVMSGFEWTAETWSEYEARLAALFGEQLREYRDRWREEGSRRGLKKPPTKRRRASRKDPYLHFEWLVRFQVQGWTHAEIARFYGRDEKGVQKACRKTADQIELTRRSEDVF